jgi:hypothetical protein
LDAGAWTALLPATAFVEGFEFQDMVTKKVLSFPAANIDALVQSLYTSLASSAGEQLPKVSDFFADPGWQRLVESVARNDDAFANGDVGVRDPKRQFEAFTKGHFDQLPAGVKDLSLLQLFHTPPSTPQIDGYAVGLTIRDRARTGSATSGRRSRPRPTREDDRLHQIVAAMNQYDAAAAARPRDRFHREKGIFTPAVTRSCASR